MKQLMRQVNLATGTWEREAGHSAGARSPHGYRPLRDLIVQLAWAAQTKGSYFEFQCQRLLPARKSKGSLWAVDHRLIRIIWLLLHCEMDHIEHGNRWTEVSRQRKTGELTNAFKKLGFAVTLTPFTAPHGAIC